MTRNQAGRQVYPPRGYSRLSPEELELQHISACKECRQVDTVVLSALVTTFLSLSRDLELPTWYVSPKHAKHVKYTNEFTTQRLIRSYNDILEQKLVPSLFVPAYNV
jgi:hypothetical protein